MRPLSFRRFLPAVIVVGGLLLAVKGEGLVRTALAEGLDVLSGDTSILAEDTAPLASDDTGENESAGKSDVLSELAKRREALDAREAEVEERTQLVAAAEKRIDDKVSTLKGLQDDINKLLGQRDVEEQKQLLALVKTYSAMKPRDAARIFNSLSDDVLIPVAAAMKADVLAPVMANMNSDAAQKLTVALANRLKMPAVSQTAPVQTDASVVCNPATPAAPAPVAEAKPGKTTKN